ncbi:MAG: hypothetical protein DRO15_01760 [Thermoprotei archaeon]|nr:MAG: hypothetical protein DRO15_01760 [Thermoprotei archaeon]
MNSPIVPARMFIIASSLLIMITCTDALHLALLLETLRLPQVIAQSFALTTKLIPMLIRDSLDSISSARLLNIQNWRALSMVVISAMECSRKLS